MGGAVPAKHAALNKQIFRYPARTFTGSYAITFRAAGKRIRRSRRNGGVVKGLRVGFKCLRVTHMMKCSAVCLGLLFSGLCLAQAAPHSLESSSCQLFAQQFYDWYVPIAQKPLDGPASDVALQRRAVVFSPQLLHALRMDSEAQALAKGDIVGLDFDPFLGSQDPADHYEARQATVKNGTCSVGVWRASPTDTSAKMDGPEAVAQLKQQNGSWRFVNFTYSVGGPDLIHLLANLRQERRKYDATAAK
jgi:hypothetical protein